MEGEALIAHEPLHDLGMLVGGIIVENDMDRLACRNLRINGVEEADELLMAMALHVLANDGSVEHVEGCKKRGRAVPLVVVGHGAQLPLFHGQSGLGAVEGLDLGFLIHR